MYLYLQLVVVALECSIQLKYHPEHSCLELQGLLRLTYSPCVLFQENRPNKAIAADSESGPVAWTDRLHSFLRQPRNASKTKAHKCLLITAFYIQNLGVSED